MFLINEFGQPITPVKLSPEERAKINEIIRQQDEKKRQKRQEHLKQLDADIALLKEKLNGGVK